MKLAATLLTAVAFAGAITAAPAQAQLPFKSRRQHWRAMPAVEQKTVVKCLSGVLQNQLPDGGVIQVAHQGLPGNPALIVPYFGHHVALAWIIGYEHTGDIRYFAAAQKWLAWCVAHQESAGHWNHWDGTRAKYRNINICDARDSSCAMYLVVFERYQRAGGKLTAGMIQAGSKALTCLESLVEPCGLTIAKPSYPVMYLMDNIETIAGGYAGAALFARLQRPAESARAVAIQKKADAGILTLFNRKARLYSWASHRNGTIESGLKDLYPHGLAQLFGCALVSADASIFKRTAAAFKPETNSAASAGSERWLMAALRFDKTTAATWRKRTIQDASTFNSNTYCCRPAVTSMTLLVGSSWMPNRLDGIK